MDSSERYEQLLNAPQLQEIIIAVRKSENPWVRDLAGWVPVDGQHAISGPPKSAK